MVLKLYGSSYSGSTKRVQLILAELNLEYEFIIIDFSNGEHKKAEYTVVQPFGQVPYLDDDGFKVYESRAIGRYLACKFGGIGTLIPDPADYESMALFEQAASVEVTDFDPCVVGLAWENVIKPSFYNGRPDPARVEHLTTTLLSKLAVYDVILSKTNYVAGDGLTIADLFHLPFGSLLESQGMDFLVSDEHPRVKRWWKEISSLPSWKQVNRPPDISKDAEPRRPSAIKSEDAIDRASTSDFRHTA